METTKVERYSEMHVLAHKQYFFCGIDSQKTGIPFELSPRYTKWKYDVTSNQKKYFYIFLSRVKCCVKIILKSKELSFYLNKFLMLHTYFFHNLFTPILLQ